MWKAGQTVTIRSKGGLSFYVCRVKKATDQSGKDYGDVQRKWYNLQGKLPEGCYLTTNSSIYRYIRNNLKSIAGKVYGK